MAEIAKFSEAVERSPGLTESSRPIFWWTKWNIFESRRAALETAGPSRPTSLIYWAGAYRDALPLVARGADTALARGELASAAQVSRRRAPACTRCSGTWPRPSGISSGVAELADRSGNPPLRCLDASARVVRCRVCPWSAARAGRGHRR